MTEKLYYSDSYLFDFSAKVIDVTEDNGRKAVILDKTAFFPEGGGQPGDEGIIDGMAVVDVQEKNGIILHYVKGDISCKAGDAVVGRVDSKLRFERMQAHSGEHIVSGVAHRLFGVENVGFHMIDLVMTVDFDKVLTKEQIAQIESEANDWVYKNVKIDAEIVPPEKLEALQYRSKLDLRENVRIVTIEGCDMCACCAPHVARTGEIGIIKLLTCVSHRGGVRLTMICGAKALKDYACKHSDVMSISDMLKAPNDATPAAVAELLEKLTEEKRKTALQRQKLYDHIAKGLECSESSIVLFADDLSPDELRELAELCKTKTKKIMAVFSGNEEQGYAFAIASESVKLRALSKDINIRLNGRGGGRDEMLQGRVVAGENEIRKYFAELEV